MATSKPYFAYGSNLYEPRLLGRVPSAEFLGVAQLTGYRLGFRKRSVDGSTKCDLAPFSQATVWGALYYIDGHEIDALDAAEGEGYRRIDLTVATGEEFVEAFSYRARPEWRADGLPYTWYRDLVIAGAQQHELPEHYINTLAALDTRDDPDADRVQRNAPAA